MANVGRFSIVVCDLDFFESIMIEQDSPEEFPPIFSYVANIIANMNVNRSNYQMHMAIHRSNLLKIIIRFF